MIGFRLKLRLKCLWYRKTKKTMYIFQFPGGGLGNENPARTIAHSPPGVKETLNYWLREKTIVLIKSGFGKPDNSPRHFPDQNNFWAKEISS